MNKCKNCKWWDEQNDIFGICFRNAPITQEIGREPKRNYSQGYRVAWPLTNADDRCGEFEENTIKS